MGATISASLIVELLSLGATHAATIAKQKQDRAVAQIAEEAAEGARRLLEARAGGPLNLLTPKQLLVVVKGLSFRDPAVVAGEQEHGHEGEEE